MKKLFFYTFMLLGALHADLKKYGLPLPYFTGVSSSFMDFRSSHFHGGIDFRTGKKTGMPVLAVSDGWIEKMVMATISTGRALVLKHRDGNSSLYYHLEEFAPKLKELVRQVQTQTGRYYFGEYTLPQPVAVTRGEQIALSGESGAGFPHLHFEIRDQNGDVLNPFFWLDLPLRDRFPPVPKGVLLRSRGESAINGEIGEVYIPVKKEAGIYSLSQPLGVDGPFDLILYVVDPTDSHKIGSPYAIDAFFDEKLFYRFRGDRYKWEDHNQLGQMYDLAHSSLGAFFYNLFAQSGFYLQQSSVNFAETVHRAQWGEHTIRIRMWDQFNNESNLTFPLVKKVDSPVRVLSARYQENKLMIDFAIHEDDLQGSFILEIWDGEKAPLVTTGAMPWQQNQRKRLSITLSGRNIPVTGEFRFYRNGEQVSTKTFPIQNPDSVSPVPPQLNVWLNHDDVVVQALLPDAATTRRRLQVHQGEEQWEMEGVEKNGRVVFSVKPRNLMMDLRLVLNRMENGRLVPEAEQRIPMVVVFPDHPVRVQKEMASISFLPASVKEQKAMLFYAGAIEAEATFLDPQSLAYTLSPEYIPFFEQVTLRIRVPTTVEKPEQIGIFRRNRRSGHWRALRTAREEGAVWAVNIRNGGVFALFRDDRAPELTLRSTGKRQYALQRNLQVRIREVGQGIDVDRIAIRFNGREPDWEYDQERSILKIQPGSLIISGQNQLDVFVVDYAGHETRRNWTLNF